MHTARQSYIFLCRCLGVDRPDRDIRALKEEIVGHQVDWSRVIDYADRESVVPLLWNALREKQLADCLPDDVRTGLSRRHQLNSIKNDRLRRQACDVTRCLNERGITPIFLKGGVSLFENGSDEGGSPRIMFDLDILVPMNELDTSVSALRAIGYQEDRQGAPWTYHYRPMLKSGEFAPVELHAYVGEQRDLLTPEEVLRDAVPIEANGIRLKSLSPIHRVFHNVIHSQLQDRGHGLGIIWLKQLCDLVRFCHTHGAEVDWQALQHYAASRRLEGVLSSRLYLGHRLLGLNLPSGMTPTFATNLHYRRCVFQASRRSIDRAVRLWAIATEQLKSSHLDLMYRCGTRSWKRHIYRIIHAVRVLWRYRNGLWAKWSDVKRKYD